MLRIGHAFFIHLSIRPRQRSLDQNMAHLNLFRRAVLVPTLLVVSLQLITTHLNSTLELVKIHGRIFDLALLRNGVGVGVLMALVECFEFGVGGVKSLAQVVLLEHGVVKLDLAVLLDELLANLRIADAGAARDQGLQLGQNNILRYSIFESCRRQVGPREQPLVLTLPDEIAARKERPRITPML